MKSSLVLSAALVLLLPALPSDYAFAQAGGVEKPTGNTRAARKAAEAKKNAATNQAPLYPNATRESPKQASDDKGVYKVMDEMFKLQEKDGAEDEIIAKADAILANPKANAFDKSSAAYLAGSAWSEKEPNNYASAIKYYQLAIDSNGLHNNNHFNAMLQLAQVLDGAKKHAEALTMVDRFLSETKSDDTTAWSIKVSILDSLGRPKDAALALEKLLVAKPNDKNIMMNLASVYQASGDDAKAAATFDKMRSAGLLTESRDYEIGYHLLAGIEGRGKDALAFIDEGLKKGILKPSYDVYAAQGKLYYDADDMVRALAAWSQAAPLSKTGDMYLNVSQMHLDADHFAEAKAAALSAKAKGVKRPGDVYQLLARSEHGLHNEAASKAALQEATKYSETKKWAEAALRQGLGD